MQDLSFVDADDPDLISSDIESPHPAITFLVDAITRLEHDQPRSAVECMQEAMNQIAVHSGLMAEF